MTTKPPLFTDASFSDDMHTIRRQRIDIDAATPEDLAALAAATKADFAEWVLRQQEKAEAFLVGLGLPAPAQLVIRDAAGWRPAPEGLEFSAGELRRALGPGERLCTGATYIRETRPELSDAWFALRLHEATRRTRALDPTDRDWQVFMLGHLFATAQSRKLFKEVTKAKQNTRDARKGGHARGEARRQSRDAVLAEMRLLIDKGHSASRAAELVAKKGLGASREANRALWKRYFKK
jgi:hypothetical protein